MLVLVLYMTLHIHTYATCESTSIDVLLVIKAFLIDSLSSKG
jgi:hypothetical protein